MCNACSMSSSSSSSLRYSASDCIIFINTREHGRHSVTSYITHLYDVAGDTCTTLQWNYPSSSSSASSLPSSVAKELEYGRAHVIWFADTICVIGRAIMYMLHPSLLRNHNDNDNNHVTMVIPQVVLATDWIPLMTLPSVMATVPTRPFVSSF